MFSIKLGEDGLFSRNVHFNNKRICDNLSISHRENEQDILNIKILECFTEIRIGMDLDYAIRSQ